MPSTLETAAGLLKTVFGPTIIELMPTETPVADIFTEREAKDYPGGTGITYPAEVQRSQGFMATGEEATIPTAGNVKYERWDFPIKYLVGRIRLSIQAIRLSESNRAAFDGVMQREMNSIRNVMKVERGRYIWGDGRGVLALCNGTTATTVLPVDAPGGVAGTLTGNRFLYPGATLAAINPASGAIRSGVFTVTNRSTLGTSVTLSGVPSGWSDNDYIVRAATTSVTDAANTSYQREPMGLLGMVDNGTYVPTFHGINRTTVPLAGSYVVSTTGTLSSDIFQRSIDVADERGDGNISDLLMHQSVRRAYIALTDPFRRYQGGDLSSPDAGTRAAKKQSLSFGTIPITVDKYAPFKTIFGIDRNGFYRYRAIDFEWADEDGSMWRAAGVGANGVDSWEAFCRRWEEFHLDYPNANFRLDAVDASAVAVPLD